VAFAPPAAARPAAKRPASAAAAAPSAAARTPRPATALEQRPAAWVLGDVEAALRQSLARLESMAAAAGVDLPAESAAAMAAAVLPAAPAASSPAKAAAAAPSSSSPTAASLPAGPPQPSRSIVLRPHSVRAAIGGAVQRPAWGVRVPASAAGVPPPAPQPQLQPPAEDTSGQQAAPALARVLAVAADARRAVGPRIPRGRVNTAPRTPPEPALTLPASLRPLVLVPASSMAVARPNVIKVTRYDGSGNAR
jgi:hypothetical protein